MKRKLRVCVALAGFLIAQPVAAPTIAQKSGGILRMYSPDSPGSMSIHEEATVFVEPMMGCSMTSSSSTST